MLKHEKGYIFWGYTELSWDKYCSFKKDKSTFIFSFNNKLKYIAKKDNDSISCSKIFGPVFCNKVPDFYFEGTLDKGISNKDSQTKFDN